VGGTAEKPLVELEILDPVFHDDGDDEELEDSNFL
jgi:hypothetical protein